MRLHATSIVFILALNKEGAQEARTHDISLCRTRAHPFSTSLAIRSTEREVRERADTSQSFSTAEQQQQPTWLLTAVLELLR